MLAVTTYKTSDDRRPIFGAGMPQGAICEIEDMHAGGQPNSLRLTRHPLWLAVRGERPVPSPLSLLWSPLIDRYFLYADLSFSSLIER